MVFLWLSHFNVLGQVDLNNTIKIETSDSKEQIVEKAAHVVPTPNQWSALQNEFIAFIHFGPNTFTAVEWGSGKEDPTVFDLKELHTDQWCEIMQDAGMKMVVLTVKHHDGFVLWQSRYTTHGIMSTDYQEGKGDVLKELAQSCKKYGLKLGVYLSPADLFQIEHPDGLYGNLSNYTKRTIPRDIPARPFANKTKFEFEVDDYNEYFLNQLFELLTEYGAIDEVWFDGAHPKRKGGQRYNYDAWRELIRTLAPNAVVFGKEDIRWCGNEGGGTRETEWNVIPYSYDPNAMNDFSDLTENDLGSREILFATEKPYYLHYQPAETNTSIRAGWFYANDIHQKVRSAGDVFDIYERSVGGNSIFLLNIPPNREGKFSSRDEQVLREVGKRIRETYTNNLFREATGPMAVLDQQEGTSFILDNQADQLIISTPKPVTINRVAIREAIVTHGERVEKHALDAYLDGEWQEIAQATNIGYQRILRFGEVTTNKIRLRIQAARATPAISGISAFYYESRPPILGSSRSVDGLVSIEPKGQAFSWNRTGHNSEQNLNSGYNVFYTTDGSTPTIHSTAYTVPFYLGKGELKAVSVLNGALGPVYEERFGLVKKDWKIVEVSSESDRRKAESIFDEDPLSFWMTTEGDAHYISVQLGTSTELIGFGYTPQSQNSLGMIEKGLVKVSIDGQSWREVERFEFGNLINDPVRRTHYFKKPVLAKYVRIEAIRIADDGKVASMAELDLF